MTNLVRGWGRVGVRGRVRVRVRFRGRSRGWVRVVDEPVATARRLITSGARGRVAVVCARAELYVRGAHARVEHVDADAGARVPG